MTQSTTVPTTAAHHATSCQMDQFDQALRRESESLELRGIAGAAVSIGAGAAQSYQAPASGIPHQRFHPIPFAPFPTTEAAIGPSSIVPQRPNLGWKGPIFPGAPLTPSGSTPASSSSHHASQQQQQAPYGAARQAPSGTAAGGGSTSPQSSTNTANASQSQLGPSATTLLLDDEARAQLRAEAIAAVARRIGMSDLRLSPAELDELLDAVLRSLNPGLPPTTPSTSVSQQQPTPDFMLNSSATGSPRPTTQSLALSPSLEGRQTIVSELQWAETREAVATDVAMPRPEKPIDAQAVACVQGNRQQPRGTMQGTTPIGRSTPNTTTTPSGNGTPRNGLTTQFGNASLNSTPVAPMSARGASTPTSVAAPKRTVRGVSIAPKPQAAHVNSNVSQSQAASNKGGLTAPSASLPLSREALGRSAATTKRLMRSASSAFSECSTADISSETSTNVATTTCSDVTQKA
eukprot:CAMPEP_0176470052 /NCGR_PEP_ID=MMETSP0127-20121128/40229_1 /TAXON_ID=938130 /ORGANISM="Platyophrya macrostoma, Strain WH" /LENGTH=462 /DNA_ID=CAMNT_0017864279 /DNA_START=263 /DNA_END=1651 /DNA_ORIENTATION=-